MAQRRILDQARPVMTELDRLIFQMETTLGKPHTVSPFQQFIAPAEQKSTKPAEQAKKPKNEGKPKQEAANGGADQPQQSKKQAKKQKKDGNQADNANANENNNNKKGGKKGGAAAASAAPALDLSEELDAYSKCDVRVGKIIECEPHPESDKLYIEKIDLGEEGRIRTIVSGLQKYVTLDEMLADKIIVFANMKPRKLAGIMSEGMVLCGQNADHTVVELMRPHADSAIGERVTLEGDHFGPDGLPTEPLAVLNPKRKIEPKLLEKLTTNAVKEGLFDGKKLVTKAGPVVSKTIANGIIG